MNRIEVTDCISRKRAIEIVKRAETKEIAYLALINLEPKEIPNCDECRLTECLANKQDDWIPLDDDSAAPGYKVICQDRYENMMLGYAWVDEYGIWVCEDDNEMMDDVIAYRPLPAPYKENK